MKRHWTFIIIGWIALGLVACTRSAATPPPPTPTLGAPASLPGGLYPTPIGGPMNAATATSLAAQAEMMQTLGAEAGGGEGGTPEATSLPPTATPVPPQPTATPVPPTAAALPTVRVPATYTIHKGEYPYCLARRFNIDPNTLLAVNGLGRGQYVFPGTVLTIPRNAPPFPGNRAWHPHPDTYTVRYGDTIYSIACYYGDVSPEAIAAANGISVNASLRPGQTLRIP